MDKTGPEGEQDYMELSEPSSGIVFFFPGAEAHPVTEGLQARVTRVRLLKDHEARARYLLVFAP